jgi:spore photoproduct lyase
MAQASGRTYDRIRDGSVIVRFDRTPVAETADDILCPHFLELKWATGCPFACAWCYLQGTFRFLPYRTKPRVKDVARTTKHLLEFLAGDSRREILNAGELSDALVGERNGQSLVRLLDGVMPRGTPHRVLLVTKSDWVENLLQVARPELFIVSFSINAPPVARRWEKGAPDPIARLDAAARLAAAGYEVRLRVDPLVPVPEWQDAYDHLLRAIFKRLVPSRITLGSLRGLQSTINNARDKSWTEFLSERSRWGRRMAASLRGNMFEHVLTRLRDDWAYSSVALCKEPVGMWEHLGLDWHNVHCNCTW